MPSLLSFSLSLRTATQADVPFLVELRRQTMTRHQLASGLVPSDAERMERVLYRFDCAQLILDGSRPVGLFKVAREGLDWQLIQIQIAPELQGRGIGEKLVSDLISEAKAQGAALTLHVLHANPARRLYERLGFRQVSDGAHEFELALGPGDTASPS